MSISYPDILSFFQQGAECERLGVPYYGNRQVTETGRPCVRWDELPAYLYLFTDLSLLPDASYEEASNKCRYDLCVKM